MRKKWPSLNALEMKKRAVKAEELAKVQKPKQGTGTGPRSRRSLKEKRSHGQGHAHDWRYEQEPSTSMNSTIPGIPLTYRALPRHLENQLRPKPRAMAMPAHKFIDERRKRWSDTSLQADQLTELQRVQDARQIFGPQPSFSRRPPPAARGAATEENGFGQFLQDAHQNFSLQSGSGLIRPPAAMGGTDSSSGSDASVSRVIQDLNHFPGMNEICRKDRLARNLNRAEKYFPRDFDFFPLPTEVLSAKLDRRKAAQAEAETTTMKVKAAKGRSTKLKIRKKWPSLSAIDIKKRVEKAEELAKVQKPKQCHGSDPRSCHGRKEKRSKDQDWKYEHEQEEPSRSSTIPPAPLKHLDNQLRPKPRFPRGMPLRKPKFVSNPFKQAVKVPERAPERLSHLKRETETKSKQLFYPRCSGKELCDLRPDLGDRGYQRRQQQPTQAPNLESFTLFASGAKESSSSTSSSSLNSNFSCESQSCSVSEQATEGETTTTDAMTSASVGNQKCKGMSRSREWRNRYQIGSMQRSICVKNTQFKIIKRVAEENGFKLVDERSEWNVMWSDTPLTADKLTELRRVQDARQIFDPQPGSSRRPAPAARAAGPGSNSGSRVIQKLNHFPGMNEICRKDRLARNLKRMKKYFPKDFDFFPETWTLPTDLGKLVYHSKRRRNSTFICKPDTGSMGRGIFLVQDLKKLNPFTKLICQVYIARPFLIDGYKFDLRVYVLITSCDPLRVYVYNEGIARFATVKYAPPDDSNLEVTYMHLTNYSLNKFSQSYEPEGSKRKLSLVFEWMRTQGYDVDQLLADIDSLLVKTVISAHQSLKHYYRSFFPRLDQGCVCFEVLGFDVLIDERMKPFLLEVNHSPSFSTELPIDEEIKWSLIQDTLDKIYLGDNVPDKRNLHKGRGSGRSESPSFMRKTKGPDGSLLTPTLQKQFQHEAKHGVNYRLIYPLPENVELYKNFMTHASAMDPQSTDMEKGSER